jgi:isopenicillin N synthase-like dioxygenase
MWPTCLSGFMLGGVFIYGLYTKAVAEKIDQACAEIGFMTIVGHNVERKVIDDCWTNTQKYFDESVEEKER